MIKLEVGKHYEDHNDVYIVLELDKAEREVRIQWIDYKHMDWDWVSLDSCAVDIPRPDLDKVDAVQKDLEELLK